MCLLDRDTKHSCYNTSDYLINMWAEQQQWVVLYMVRLFMHRVSVKVFSHSFGSFHILLFYNAEVKTDLYKVI